MVKYAFLTLCFKAEDMEFSECCRQWSCYFVASQTYNVFFFLLVDAAAREEDPLRRIGFVAAFAMSNYSSTIGRIAKPFNPMLVRNHSISSVLPTFGLVFLS
jgi:hypothetical protein